MYDIKNRRQELGLTLEDVGDAIGVGKSTVRKWENGMIENMKRDKISLLSKVLRISPLLLLNDEDEYNNQSITQKINDNVVLLSNRRKENVLHYTEKQIEEQQKESSNVIYFSSNVDETLTGYVSAGTGEFLIDEVNESIQIPQRIIPGEHYDMVLQVNGDSMEPMFEDHEYIFVKKTNDIRSGQIGVFIIDGESYLKKAYIENNHLRLVSLNKKYDDLQFNDVNDIKVIGTVVL